MTTLIIAIIAVIIAIVGALYLAKRWIDKYKDKCWRCNKDIEQCPCEENEG